MAFHNSFRIMYKIAIDLGGTIIKIGLLSYGKVQDDIRLSSQLSIGLAPNLPRIKDAINSLLSRNHATANELSGIGLAFPGLVNPINNSVISTNEKYDDACELDLNKWVCDNWNVPFYMDNDARLAVVGEWYKGAAAGKKNVVMVTIGTGIGTGVIIDGKTLYGQHFQAGSLGGHFIVDYRGRRCSCGNKGCVEALSSSFFLPTIIKEHPLLSAPFKEQAIHWTFKEIFKQAGNNDKEALILRNECLDIWSAAIITYIHAYDPEIVVLGGGIMNSREVILPYIEERVSRYAWCPSGKVKIVSSQLSDSAALHGLDYHLNKKQNHEIYI